MNAATTRVAGAASRIAENAPELDLPTEIVNLTLSKTAFKANVKVLETASEMSDTLLHSFDEQV